MKYIPITILYFFLSTQIFSQRVPAEFEKQEGIVFTWLLENQLEAYPVDSVHVQMVEHLVKDNTVYINYHNKNQKSRIENVLAARHIGLDNVRFIKYDILMGSYPRDYGPEWIYENKTLNIVDMNWSFYGYIPPQRTFAKMINKNLEGYDRFLQKKLEIPSYKESVFVSEGGGKEFNGKGVLMLIEQTEFQRNPNYSKLEIETEYKRIFNIKKIIWLPKPSYDDENMFADYIINKVSNRKVIRSASANGHIDEFCRFVSSNTILLADVTEEEANSNEIHRINKQRFDTCYAILKKETDIDGKPYTIIRMPVAVTIFKEVTKKSGVYNNIFSMVEATQLKKMLDGSDFPKEDNFLVLPALSYCNFSIANNVVLMSKYWTEGLPETIKQKDEQAMEILRKIFPDRKVIAINAMALNFGGGGLHCNTKHIPLIHEE
jgi:agmatine deiminase